MRDKTLADIENKNLFSRLFVRLFVNFFFVYFFVCCAHFAAVIVIGVSGVKIDFHVVSWV